MEAVFVKESMHIAWVAEAGLVENIQQIVKEYRTSRALLVSLSVILFSLCSRPELFPQFEDI